MITIKCIECGIETPEKFYYSENAVGLCTCTNCLYDKFNGPEVQCTGCGKIAKCAAAIPIPFTNEKLPQCKECFDWISQRKEEARKGLREMFNSSSAQPPSQTNPDNLEEHEQI